MSDELERVIQSILNQCPEEFRPAVRGFYLSIKDVAQIQWKPPDRESWLFSVQDLKLAFPDPDKFLGFRVLIQVSTPFTFDPRMVSEISVMIQVPESVEALAIEMRNLDENIVPDNCLGYLGAYIRGLRDIIVNIVKKRMAMAQQAVQQQPQTPQKGTLFSQPMPQEPPAAPAAPPPPQTTPKQQINAAQYFGTRQTQQQEAAVPKDVIPKKLSRGGRQ